MTLGNLTKEFHKLQKNIRTLSGGQAEIAEWDDEDVSTFKVDVKPRDGVYKGGTFCFKVALGETFPETAPVIRCETQIYHPNIDPTEEYDDTNVCLNMFNSDEWQEAYGIDGIVQGLLFLFYEPNLEDPLSPYFDSTSEEEFETNVLASLKGEIVEGVQYVWNFGEKETSKENVDPDSNTTKGDNSKNNMEDKADIAKGDNPNVEDVVILREKRQGVDLDIIRQRRQGIHCDNISMISDPQCNNLSSADVGDQSDNLLPEPCDPSESFMVKTEDLTTQTSDSNPPDLIPTANTLPDCQDVTAASGSCDLHQPLVDSGGQDLSVQSEINLSHQGVTLCSYDAVMPEMNLFFLMINKLTKLFKTCPQKCKK
ncbi:uncharacterized protein LOC124129208 [Haliotis rufescens]|uniref:uncharacterized protein LOC124129208 n=1 Tax=Haliotis rufescens TaxID=6454 RepID=UPI00201F7F12|nr:uncharacterized protein LOC124129208 [Haliotis rufescens]